MSFWMVLLERSSSGNFRFILLALGPVAAIAFYGYVMSRYRNADKSYQFERTTRVDEVREHFEGLGCIGIAPPRQGPQTDR